MDWQEKYLQFQMLQQQLEKINEHVELLQQQDSELEISQNAIAQISQTALNNEVLVPIANGIFLKAELKENKKLIVHVGSDTAVEHNVERVIHLLEKQQKEIKVRTAEAETIAQEMQEQLGRIYQLISAEKAEEQKREIK